jgi:hypothetical protein
VNTPRDWCITHGEDDYRLRVFTYKRRSRLTRILTEKTMSILGHPCCGNLLGKIDIIGALCNKLLTKAYAYEHGHEVVVLDLTVTEDEAFTADPLTLELTNELRNK